MQPFDLIQRDLKQLDEYVHGTMAVARNPSKALTGTASDKIASVLTTLYTDVNVVEATGKSMTERHFAFEQAGKILDEVSKIAGLEQDSVKEKDDKSSKEDVSEMADPISLCREFLNAKKEKVDQEILDKYKDDIKFLEDVDHDELIDHAAVVFKLLNALPADIIKKLKKIDDDKGEEHVFVRACIKNLIQRLEKDPDPANFKKILDPEKPLSKHVVDYLLYRFQKKDTAFCKKVIQNFNALKDQGLAQNVLEAAIYFAQKAPSQDIGPSEKEMMPALEFIKKQTMENMHKSMAEAIASSPANTSDSVRLYKDALKEVQHSIAMAKKIIPSFDSSYLEKDLLTSEELKEVEQLNNKIFLEVEDFDKKTASLQKMAFYEGMGEDISALQTLKSLLDADIKKIKTIFPQWELNTIWQKFISGTFDFYQHFKDKAIPIIESIAKQEQDFLNDQYYSVSPYKTDSRMLTGRLDQEEISKLPLIPSEIFLALEERKHNVDSPEKANELLDQFKAKEGQWILFFNSKTNQMEQAIRRFKGEVASTEFVPIKTKDDLRKLSDYRNGISRYVMH